MVSDAVHLRAAESARRRVTVPVILAVILFGFSIEPGNLLPRPAAVLMLSVQLITCLPWARRLRGAWTLAVQILLAPWSGLPGFLAGSVLLATERRIRWVLFTLIVLAAGPLAPGDGGLFPMLNSTGNALAHGLIIYALTKLIDLHAELHATQGVLAADRVAAERERTGRNLDAVLGADLAETIRLAGQGRQAARELVAVAREATGRVRAASPTQSAGPADVSPGAMTPRLAWPIVIATHLEYLVVGAAFLFGEEIPGWRSGLYATALIAVIALQAYHCLPRPLGLRPPHAAWTLGAQLALALGMLAVPDGPYPQLVAFAAASVLILLPARFAWATATALTALAAGAVLARPDRPDMHATALVVLDIVVIALVFYGLALLTGLVHQVREAHEALAAQAVARERRRIARDVHDLLGYGLSAVALQGELAARDPDPRRADGHLADAARQAGRALADLRAIPGDHAELTLTDELDSAKEVLAAAGITLRVRGDANAVAAAAKPLFATALREAMTNVLRHAPGSSWCAVEFGPGLLRVTSQATLPPVSAGSDTTDEGVGGNGLRNLRERAAALGAHLEAGPALDDRHYTLTLCMRPATVPAGE